VKKIIIVVVVLMSFLSFISCKSDDVVYKYRDTRVYEDIALSSTVYRKDETLVRISGIESEYLTVVSYDRDFNYLDDITCEKGKNCLILKGENASRISGLKISDSLFGWTIKLRKLDSRQFASLFEMTVLDAESEVYGDREKYYTKEELESERKRQEEHKKETQKAFSLLFGTWVGDREGERIVFTPSAGAGLDGRVYFLYEGKEEEDDFYADEAWIDDYNDGTLHITLSSRGSTTAPVNLVFNNEDGTFVLGGIEYRREPSADD